MSMKKEVVQKGDPVLHTKAEAVAPNAITASEVQELIQTMKETLAEKESGVALAAPQIGVSKRIFVVAPRVFDNEKSTEGIHLVFINPEIIKESKTKHHMDEGCLSIDGMYGTVPRAEKVTVQAYDEHGKTFTRGASGLLAQIFQHEIDHLNGVLYTDKAIDVWELE